MRGLIHTHFPPHEPYIVANLLEGSCMNALHTMHYLLCIVHNRSPTYVTSTWYSFSPLCEHNIMSVYKSHLQLNAEHTVIFIVHVCGNALYIGTQCLIQNDEEQAIFVKIHMPTV